MFVLPTTTAPSTPGNGSLGRKKHHMTGQTWTAAAWLSSDVFFVLFFFFFLGGVTTVITDPRPVILKYVQQKSVTIVVSIQAGKLHIESDQKPMFLLICSL